MANTFFLVIPSPQAKQNPNEVCPIYVHIGNDRQGAAKTRYYCPFCESEYRNHRTCEKHMGIGVMFSNVGDIGCVVLRRLGGEREIFVRSNFPLVRKEIEMKYGKKTVQQAKPKRNKRRK